ncbi:hypothetical protein BDR03DRAFT_954818 [Suillus americanus]|nr:hypothetical protein BDR03DRAFT_954818 [Suillus americanus]
MPAEVTYNAHAKATVRTESPSLAQVDHLNAGSALRGSETKPLLGRRVASSPQSSS